MSERIYMSSPDAGKREEGAVRSRGEARTMAASRNNGTGDARPPRLGSR